MTSASIVRSKDFLTHFAEQWLAAWNSHDLERILALYEDDFSFSSPVLNQLLPSSGGRLTGKEAARAYWSRAFAAGVNLHFEHVVSFAGVESMVIHYKGLHGKRCAEYFRFSPAGKVAESRAHEC